MNCMDRLASDPINKYLFTLLKKVYDTADQWKDIHSNEVRIGLNDIQLAKDNNCE